MTYAIVHLGITQGQLQTLLEGGQIFLEKSQFSGDIPVPLTKAQATLIANASRGIRLKLSGPQRKALSMGEGIWDHFKPAAINFAKKVGNAALKAGREGINLGLDSLQKKIPTRLAGEFQPMADRGVTLARAALDRGLDHIQSRIRELFGGAAGKRAIDNQMGAGWFDEYLLPGVETAARIGMPLMSRRVGRGFRDSSHDRPILGVSRRPLWMREIDKKMGSGWFDEYLLPGLETAANIAKPYMKKVLRGNGLFGSLGGILDGITGQGWFSDYIVPGLQTAATVALPGPAGAAVRLGLPFVVDKIGLKGKGWEPMTQKKVQSEGLVL